jgi:hypothetical protein
MDSMGLERGRGGEVEKNTTQGSYTKETDRRGTCIHAHERMEDAATGGKKMLWNILMEKINSSRRRR